MRLDRRTFTQGLMTVWLSPSTTIAVIDDGPDPEFDRVVALLEDWVGRRQRGPGVSVGWLVDDGALWAWRGVMSAGDSRELTLETLFAIGSLAPVFTGLLLTDAVLRKEVELADPVRLYLPPGTKVPTYRGHEITLLDLAMQTSGLPQEFPVDSTSSLLDFLSRLELPAPIGEHWARSGLNYELIGMALSNVTGMSYESLIQKRIAKPLYLRHTGTQELAAYLADRRARPHLDHDTPSPGLTAPPILGAWHSSVSELTRFLMHAATDANSPLSDAFAAMLQTTHPAPALNGEQAIGWAIDRSGADARVYCSGIAAGFASAMMFIPGAGRGVVALGNSSATIDGLALEILGS